MKLWLVFANFRAPGNRLIFVTFRPPVNRLIFVNFLVATSFQSAGKERILPECKNEKDNYHPTLSQNELRILFP